jgi:protein arginine N-methyltransferase 1
VLSTAPGRPETHWKQTVFFLPESFSVTRGLNIQARISLTTDPENPRRYNVNLELRNTEENEEFEHENCQCDKCRLLKALELDEDMKESVKAILFKI